MTRAFEGPRKPAIGSRGHIGVSYCSWLRRRSRLPLLADDRDVSSTQGPLFVAPPRRIRKGSAEKIRSAQFFATGAVRPGVGGASAIRIPGLEIG